MKELLKKWSELEPERVKRRWDGCLGVAYDDGGLVLEERPGTYGSPEFHKFATIYVQAAVQEAIEARGWDWSTAARMDKDGRYYEGAIYRPVKGTMFRELAAQKHRLTAAEALLSAYLKVLAADLLGERE